MFYKNKASTFCRGSAGAKNTLFSLCENKVFTFADILPCKMSAKVRLDRKYKALSILLCPSRLCKMIAFILYTKWKQPLWQAFSQTKCKSKFLFTKIERNQKKRFFKNQIFYFVKFKFNRIEK